MSVSPLPNCSLGSRRVKRQTTKKKKLFADSDKWRKGKDEKAALEKIRVGERKLTWPMYRFE